MKKFIKENWQRLLIIIILSTTLYLDFNNKIGELKELTLLTLCLSLEIWKITNRIEKLEEKLDENNERNKEVK